MSTAPPVPTFKLPVWETLRAALYETRDGFGVYVRLMRIPVVVWLIGQAVLLALINPAFFVVSWRSLTFAEIGIYLCVTTVQFLAVIPSLTAWHRHLILTADRPDARASYSISGVEWRYMETLAALLALRFIALYPMGLFLVLAPAERSMLEARVWLFLGSAVAWLLIVRWLLLLPAAAIGQPMRWREAHRVARGNSLRLWVALLILLLASYLADLVLSGLIPDIDMSELSRLQAAPYLLSKSAWSFVALPVVVAVLSISYRQLVAAMPRKPEP